MAEPLPTADMGDPKPGTNHYHGVTNKTVNEHEARLVTVEAGGGGGIPATLVDAKGDLIVATAPDVVARLAIGAEGTSPVSRAAATTGIVWEIVAGGGGAALATTPTETLFSLTAPYSSYNQANRVVVSGTFVAATTAHWVTVDVSGQVLGCGGHRFDLLVGVPAPDAPLRDYGGKLITDTVGFNPVAGTTEYKHFVVGSLPAETYIASLSRRVLLTGLTVGRTYTIELSGAALGGAKTTPVGVNPYYPEVTLDDTHVLAPCYTSNRVDVVSVGLRPGHSVNDSTGEFRLVRSIALAAGAAPYHIAPIPGGTLAAVTNFGTKTVSIVDWAAGTVVLTTAAMPAGHTPRGVACSSTIAYVSCTSGTIYPVTIATGAIGTGVSVGVTDTLFSCSMTPDGTRLWVVAPVANAVYPVAIPALTVGSPVALGAGSEPNHVTAGPDGSAWVSCTASGIARRVTPALALGIGIQTTNTLGTVNGLTCIGLAADGRLAYLANGRRVVSARTANGVIVENITFPDTAGNQSGVAVTDDEYVILAQLGSSTLFQWPSNTFKATPGAAEPGIADIHVEKTVGASAIDGGTL